MTASSSPVPPVEAVEAAARANFEYLTGRPWAVAAEPTKNYYRQNANLMLTAAVPLLYAAWAEREQPTPVIGPHRGLAPESRHDIVRFYFSDADPVAECGCGLRAVGDAPTDAFRAWWRHSATEGDTP